MFKTPQGLIYKTTPKNFTLLVRHHKAFWGIIGMCLLIGAATLEFEDIGFLPIHEKITCTRELNGCQYTKVQLHPVLFWQSENTLIPIDKIELSLYDSRYREWEIELSDRSLIFNGSQMKAKASQLSGFLQEKNDFVTATENHGFIGVLQLLIWLVFLFPIYLLLLDRSGRAHSAQSIYADRQVIIVKRYGFFGRLKQKTYPTGSAKTLRVRLQTKKVKGGENYFIHFEMISNQGKTVRLIKKVPTDNLQKKHHQKAFDDFTSAAQAMTDFLNAQGADVALSVVP